MPLTGSGCPRQPGNTTGVIRPVHAMGVAGRDADQSHGGGLAMINNSHGDLLWLITDYHGFGWLMTVSDG